MEIIGYAISGLIVCGVVCAIAVIVVATCKFIKRQLED